MASSRKRVLRVTGTHVTLDTSTTMGIGGRKARKIATERSEANEEKQCHTSQGRENLKTEGMFNNIKSQEENKY